MFLLSEGISPISHKSSKLRSIIKYENVEVYYNNNLGIFYKFPDSNWGEIYMNYRGIKQSYSSIKINKQKMSTFLVSLTCI